MSKDILIDDFLRERIRQAVQQGVRDESGLIDEYGRWAFLLVISRVPPTATVEEAVKGVRGTQEEMQELIDWLVQDGEAGTLDM